jgi:5-methylcytosine-specific restriction protein A
MPYVPLRPCRHPGCSKLVRGGYCEIHQKEKKPQSNEYNKRRPSWHKLYDRKWRSYTAVYLANHPYCAECLKRGKHVNATQVDHIKPHKGDMTLFWDTKNHQGLCKSCHSRKTAKENGGFGNTPTL